MDQCVDNIDPETHLPDGSQQMTQARREPEQGGRNQFLLTQSPHSSEALQDRPLWYRQYL
jgi:hypothetical protein